MSRVIIFLAFFVFSTGVAAQTEAGSWFIGTQFQLNQAIFSYTSTDTYKQFMARLTPDVGYFPIDNLNIGLNPIFAYIRAMNPPGQPEFKNNDYEYGLAPLARYYYNFTPSWSAFSEARYQWSSLTRNANEDQDGIRRSRFRLGLGVAYFLNPNVSLESNLGYQWQQEEIPAIGMIESRILKDRGVDFSIGLQFYLGSASQETSD